MRSVEMRKDVCLKRFFSDKRRFADVINGFGCGGNQCVQPEDLQEQDTAEGIWDVEPIEKNDAKDLKETARDIIRKVAFGMNFAIIGVGNQETEDYSLPYRVMSYDVSRYGKQVTEIKQALKESGEKLQGGEYLYSFRQDSKLYPVVTFVLFYGKHEYDGAVDLHGLIDFTDIPEGLKNMVQNYHVNLIDIRRIENFDMLHTDVKTVFELIRDAGDKENWEKHCKELGELDEIAWDVVETYTSLKMSEEEKAQCRTENGGINMCKAWDDRFLDGKEAGIQEGKEAGKEEMMVALVRKGIMTLEQIVDSFGVTKERMQELLTGDAVA